MGFNTATGRGLETFLRRHGLDRDWGPYVCRDKVELQKGQYLGNYVEVVSRDFTKSSSGSLGEPLTTHDDSASGSPTLAFVDDASYGEFTVDHDGTAEAQLIGVETTHEVIDMSKSPVMEARVKLPSALSSSDQRVVIGMASVMGSNQTMDNVANHAWFRIEGADDSILTEAADGINDFDDQDTGFDAGTDYRIYQIDAKDLSRVQFKLDGAVVDELDMSNLSANTSMLGVVLLQRDGGSETDGIDIDYIQIHQER